MKTTIVDFVKQYAEKNITRFHMPGHKGRVFFGLEPFDITEIEGADVLYHGNGIIRESEQNASALFGSGATHYSTEGSSLCIKAMLAALAMEHSFRETGERPFLLAARNVHRSMIDACALLDFDVRFLQQKESRSICSSVLRAEDLEETLQSCNVPPLGIYITSPDYLGQMTDISEISGVARRWGIPLLVDNAHGAYLHFLEEKKHPLDLGAAMCCDSAHKTLSALTGAAYLHIHKDYLKRFEAYAAKALTLFGSTSPSYLLLQSLDRCNIYLKEGYQERLAETVQKTEEIKEQFLACGICVQQSEPLKIVIDTATSGYKGTEIAAELRKYFMECEYADWQYVVLMVTPENTEEDFRRLSVWAEATKLVSVRKKALPARAVWNFSQERVCSIREAVFSESEMVPARESVGRVCAAETVSCPPAVPIAISGERITKEMAEAFLRFGIEEVCVIKDGNLSK